MSKLLKSKFLLGVMIVAVMFVGAVAVKATTASAADCSITTTLRVGSKGSQVACLQAGLSLTADGSFGPKTKAAVVAWQKAANLVADGVFGAKSRAAWTGGSVVSGNFAPAGCTSVTGYSPVTGGACYVVGSTVGLPAGCTSASGFSPVTGASCSTGATSQTGPVTAMLSQDNPATGTIVAGQATADLMHVTFTGNGTVNSVTLARGGISDQNTLSNVYLYDGVQRLTDGYSFNTNGTITINNLNLVVNGSKTISVKADVYASTGSYDIFVTMTGFTSGTSVNTTSIKGNDMYIASNSTLASLSFNAANSVALATVNAGTSSYAVWRQSVQVNTRSLWLKAANFRVTGSAPSDALANVNLFVDGVKAGNNAALTTMNGSNYLSFDMTANPVSLTTGSHTLEVRADIVKGSNYDFTVSIQQASDLMVMDPQVGVNLTVGITGAGVLPSTAGKISIGAGTATIVNDNTFNSMTNVTGGASNVVIAKFKIHGYGEDVKVTSIPVTPVLVNACTSGSTYNTAPCDVTTAGATHTKFATGNGLQNVTLYFNGSQVGSQVSWGSGALTFTLGSQMIIPAGVDSTLEVRADLRTSPASTGANDSTATSGLNYTAGTVSANLGAGTAEGWSSKSSYTTPTVVGHTVAIQTGLLAVAKNTGYASQSVNPNTQGVKIGSFVLQNQSTSESVRVTGLTVGLTTDGATILTTGTTPALTNFSALKTSETSGSGATPVQPQASNVFSVDFTIAAGATKTVDILADTSSATSGNVVATLVVSALGSSSNVAISQNGNGTAVVGQTISLAIGTVSNNVALLTAPSTAQQFVPAANGGATNATKATFKIQATGGSATISEMKFTVNDQDFSSVGSYGAITTGTGKVFTPTTAAEADRFKVGDSVQIAGATTNGIGTVTAVTPATSVTVAITVAPTGGTNTYMRLVPATVTSVSVGNVSAPVVSGVAWLQGLNLSVPNGGSGLSQDVYISYAEVGTNGVKTGSTSRVALEYIKYQSGNTTTTLSTTTLGGSGLTGVSAPTMKVVGSAPSITLANSGNTNLTTGSVDVGHVIVTANAKGDVTLNALPINVTMTDATLANAAPGYNTDGIVVKDSNNNPVTTTNSAMSGSAAGGTSTITFTNGYTIPAGTSQTFKIYMQVATAPNTNGANTSAATMGLGSADLLSWTDTAGNASATTGLDVAGSAATTLSNKFKDGTAATVTPGFFYNYPTSTVH